MRDKSMIKKVFRPIGEAFQKIAGVKMPLQPWTNASFLVILAAGLIVSLSPAEARAADSIPRMSVQELKGKMDSGDRIVILDVRTAQDYSTSPNKIRGAIRIPVDQLKSRYTELPAAEEIVTYCT
ncbi:MAG: hypothetical protein EG826_09940 [Deltaproteobacteria bacterium]|nr:hypothetical protein [Deltaproteobacteria bacterium]